MDKSVGFLILLKDTFLFGLLAVLIIVNIIVVKNRLSVTKSEIIKLKDDNKDLLFDANLEPENELDLNSKTGEILAGEPVEGV